MAWRAAAVFLVASLVVSAWATAAPPKTLSGLCQVPGAKGDVVQFGGMTGGVVGSGKVGIVLANTSDGKLCDWVLNESSLMKGFAQRGYRVLLFNYRGTTEAAQARDDAVAAVELRKLGSPKVVLGGGSIGGAVSIEAATVVKPAPSAVIGLSAASDDETRVIAAAKKLTVPLLLVAATQDSYASSTKAIYRASSSKPKRLLLVSGTTHAFFDLNPAARKVDATVLAFVAAHT
jgi:pimeloyl-ACP methyl ester carboxylesterase